MNWLDLCTCGSRDSTCIDWAGVVKLPTTQIQLQTEKWDTVMVARAIRVPEAEHSKANQSKPKQRSGSCAILLHARTQRQCGRFHKTWQSLILITKQWDVNTSGETSAAKGRGQGATLTSGLSHLLGHALTQTGQAYCCFSSRHRRKAAHYHHGPRRLPEYSMHAICTVQSLLMTQRFM